MNAQLISRGLKTISTNPTVLKMFLDIYFNLEEVSLPNIYFPTMGGEFFWKSSCEENGWRIQWNTFTHHARILDQDDYRVAWGSLMGMQRVFEQLDKAGMLR